MSVMRDYVAIHNDSNTIVNRGDTVIDFRGDPATFQYVSRPPSVGKTGRVMVAIDKDRDAEFFPGVFDLSIERRADREEVQR